MKAFATHTQRDSAIGGGWGALAGAALGDSKGAAVVGAGVGAPGAFIRTTQRAKRKAAMEQATAGTGVEVTQTDRRGSCEPVADNNSDAGRGRKTRKTT